MTHKNEFQLESCRTIRLLAINQWGTYPGLLEGVPTKSLNESMVKHALDKAMGLWGGEPYLIQPPEKPIELPMEYPFGTPASIPGITCIAQFQSFGTARDDTMDFSELTIVWFQSEFAFPIHETVQDHIRTIDWDKHARDCEY